MTDTRSAPSTTASEPPVSHDVRDGITIANRGGLTTIGTSDAESPAVKRAIADLRADFDKTTNASTSTRDSIHDVQIVIGTVGTSPLIDDAIRTGQITLDGLADEYGNLIWEAYVIRETDGQLWIIGADRRGTIYGIYSLTAAIGVSPWWWFADVPAKQRDHVTIPYGTFIADHPSVRYRGLFLNDEEELDAWARAHTRDGTIGPSTYRNIFELLLRLKANYIWPAMHVNAFNADPENGRLAQEMGIVVGTSHCDMLLRSNQNEWEPWKDSHDAYDIEYDYSLDGPNRGALQKYWQGSVDQNIDYEVSWTLGMRGIHDSGFAARAIDDNDDLTSEQKHRARVDLLAQVIHDQRQLLQASLDLTKPAPLQTFVPYKEVLDYYDDGLDVPDDVTIIWSDDSFGHMRRFPNEQELSRSGGHGLYFHSSYWSPSSRSYLWISSMPLAHMKHELKRSWDHGIRTVWVDNIGSLKPLEQDAEFFLRYAWEAGKETTTADTTDFLRHWIDRSFSGGHGARAAAIIEQWAETTSERRLEHLSNNAFSQILHGDEFVRRLDILRSCFDDATEILHELPDAERDAFHELVLFRIHASYLTNAQFYFADRSTLSARQGKQQAADLYLDWSRGYDRLRRSSIRHYNEDVAAGKWNGVMTPDAFPPPATAQYPAATPALTIGDPALGVVVWGEATPSSEAELVFSPETGTSKWIEIFNEGAGEIRFRIEADDWIDLDVKSGEVSTEQRVAVRLRDPAGSAGRSGLISVTDTDRLTTLYIPVAVEARRLGTPAQGAFIEQDGTVSIAADLATWMTSGRESTWDILKRPGRTRGDLLAARTFGEVTRSSPQDAAGIANYEFVLTTEGAHSLVILRYPSLNATSRMRIRVRIDDLPPITIEAPTTDEYRGTWTDVVIQGMERLERRLPHLEAGAHRLRIETVDDGFILSNVLISTLTRSSPTLNPKVSVRQGAIRTAVTDTDPSAHDIGPVQKSLAEAGIDPLNAPRPPTVYIPRHYWDRETTFTRNLITPGDGRYAPADQSRKGQRKNLLAAIADRQLVARNDEFFIDVIRALRNDHQAWTSDSLDAPTASWEHTQAETANGRGLALHIGEARRFWDDPDTSPGIHFSLDVVTAGIYRTWALVKFDSDHDDSFYLAVDGAPQPLTDQFSGGDMFSFGAAQVWIWIEISDLTLTAGSHVISVLARKSRLRIDRLFLTQSDNTPPVDAAWPA